MKILAKISHLLHIDPLIFFLLKHLSTSQKNKFSIEKANQILESFYPDGHYSCLRKDSYTPIIKYDIGIIIPCYNVENTIRSCLDSCLAQQTSASIHIIAINDGSIDHTPKILDEYKDRITIIHQKNLGAGYARNQGLNILDCEYVTFVDADDILPPNALHELFTCAKMHDAKLVQGSLGITTQNHVIYRTFKMPDKQLNPSDSILGYVCGKLYHHSIFKNITFPHASCYEDSIINQIIIPTLFHQKSLIYSTSRITYHYYARNVHNITHITKYKPNCLNSLYLLKSLYQDHLFLNLPINQSYYEYILKMCLLSYKRAISMPKHIRHSIFIVEQNWLQTHFSTFHTTKYPDIEYALKHQNEKLMYALAILLPM